tara:strand:+ start:389 stop:511 length:123 start_codon:yes stop_codon:yes gene_type:complete
LRLQLAASLVTFWSLLAAVVVDIATAVAVVVVATGLSLRH